MVQAIYSPDMSMRYRKATWLLCLLAAVLNLGGGPMAWARAAAPEAATAEAVNGKTPVAAMSPDCHQHAYSGQDAPAQPADSQTPPCCETGSCACVAPHGGPMTMAVPLSADVVHGGVTGATPHDVPSTVIDDALRPPIR